MNLQYPLIGIGTYPGIFITQFFGANPQNYPAFKGHMGVDFGCPTGTPVYAAHEGNISFAEEPNGYGHHIYNQALDGSFRTIYGHLLKYVGSPRQVKAGELIAYSNNTGMSTGPHLHFGLQILPLNFNNGYAGCIDPMPYIKGKRMLVFFQVKGSQTIWSLMDSQWIGFSDVTAFNNYINGRPNVVIIELDQTEFDKLSSSPDVFKS